MTERVLTKVRWLLVFALAWMAGSVVVTPVHAQAPDQTVFGPKQYVRTTGAPNQYTDTFTVPSTVVAPFQLRIVNGSASGSNRISSAWVKVNGVQVAGSADFGLAVAQVERVITLGPNNTLEVSVASTPGAYLTITVLGTRNLPVPTSLSPNPLSITEGASGTLTATLSPAPTSGGTLTLASSNAGVAAVAASVGYAAGQTQVAIPVSGGAAGSATIAASANGGSASATVNVTPAVPTLTSLAPSSVTLTQGASGNLTVTISSAQASDASVALSSSAPGVASVPAAVTIPAGQVSAPVAVTGNSPGSAQVTASLNGSFASSQVTVTPAPPTVVSLVPVVSTVTLGANTTLTLTISSAQPTDTTVPLVATPPGILLAPTQVVVPAGQTSVPVLVGTLAFGQAGVTASLNGSTASAVIYVVSPPVAITSLAPATFTMTVGATSQFTVTINSAQLANTDVALVADQPSVLQVPASVTIAQGQTSAVFTVTGLTPGNVVITASANNTSKTAAVHVSPQPAAMVSLLPDPLPLQQGATGTLVATIGIAQEVDTSIALASSAPAIANVPSTVTIPAGAVSANVPVNALLPGSAVVTASVNSTSVTSTVTVTPPPPIVVSVTPAALSLPKGMPGVLRVTLSRAPNAATAVALVSSDTGIASVPPQVNVASGALFADFPVTANAAGTATITASLNGGSAASALTVTAPELVSLTLSPQAPTNYTGESVPFTAIGSMTDGTTQDFTTLVTWTSSNVGVATIASTGIASALAAGTTTVGASYTFTSVLTGQPVTIASSTVLTVKVPVGLVLTAPVSTLIVGQNATVTVSTSDPAPLGGLVVALTGSGSGSGTFPVGVTIPENGTQATFTFTATAVGSVTVTATAQNRLPGAITFTLQPQLAITAVSPTSGDVGTLVTLTGTGFDPVAANNAIVFPGINTTTIPVATLTATATQITVRVPPLAATGPISLTNTRGTVLSPPFTVAREQNFDLVVSPAALTVFQGASTAAQAQLASTGTKPYTGLVTLSVQGLPNGVTASFAPAATLSAFQTGAVTFSASAAAASGSYTLTVRADAKEAGVTFSRSGVVTLNVQSGAGVTGVKGRFVTPENIGVAGIIVRADIAQNPQPQTTTDAAGNFQLAGLPAGTVTFRFDATPANPLYPIWPFTTTVVANQVSVIPDWTLIPPPTDDKFTPLLSGAAQTQTISDARYPGLAITIPAGTTIIGWDGVPKSRMAVERLDPDKLPVAGPPIPTKSVYQLFFGTPMGGLPSQPIPVTLPNDLNLEPGEVTPLWYYDGSPMGGTGEWKQGGTGTVSADGKVIVTNAGSGIPRFCGVCGLPCFVGNMNNAPRPPCPECDAYPPPPMEVAGASVTLATGQELIGETDLNVAALIPLSVSRKYNPFDAYANIAGTTLSLGQGWALNHDVTLLSFGGAFIRIALPGNARVDFTSDGAGAFEVKNDTRFFGAKLRAVGSNWELTFKDGRLWRFAVFGAVNLQYLIEQRDTNGNSLIISRNSNGKVTKVQGAGRSLDFSYGPNGFVNAVTDPIGRAVSYAYNAQDRISTVTAPDGKTTNYTYVDDNEFPAIPACTAVPGGLRLKTIQRPGQTALQTLFYGPGRRVLRETLEDGSDNKFSYTVVGACVTHVSNPAVKCAANCPTEDSWENFQAGWRFVGGTIAATTFTDANGKAVTQRFNSAGKGTQVTDSQGQTVKYVRDSSNRVVSMTDALGRTSTFQYDAKGNRTRETDPLGRVTDVTYDATWNKPTSITRYLPDNTPVTQGFTYDTNNGNLLTSIDALGNTTAYTYSVQGQLKTITVPGNRTTTLNYNASGDLVSAVDPLGNTTLLAPDAVGRIAKATDPLGYETVSSYNPVDQLAEVLDANAGSTKLTYDTKRNLASVINPLNVPIESYQYDNLNRLTQKTDAKGKVTGYQYDTAGNLSQVTDRKSQLTTFTYDNQNRPIQISFTDATQTRSYDAAGRLAEVREGSGSIATTYDNANRVVRVLTETSSGRFEVAYEYDTLDRVTTRTVNGSDPTTYTYDNAGRPLTIGYRGQTTTYVWDTASRLTSKTLPNGIKQEFTYDDADRLLTLTYRKTDNSIIEQLAYSYDAKGLRLTKSSGTTSVPETPISAVYDTANRLTTLTLTGTGQIFNLTYDDNGNLATKTEQGGAGAVTNYTWDARNRLIGISAPGLTASFEYDALGRRASKAVNGQTIGFVYDGAQAIGEVTGGTISTAILTTLAIDDVVARYTTQGTRTYLVDALGSVIAQAKADQSIQNYYGYSAYGESQTLGPDEGNSVQYTGRENDGTGVMYYRARYYDTVLKRFVSEDPIGLNGGDNFYTYVRGDPVRLIDPMGLYWEYSQSTGQLWYFPPNGGAAQFSGEGYAGRNEALNNPLYQLEVNVGPLPEGIYTIGKIQDNITTRGTTLRESMRLYQRPGTSMFGRDGFLIHGGNFSTLDSSNGCIVLPTEVRRQVGSSSDRELRVVR